MSESKFSPERDRDIETEQENKIDFLMFDPPSTLIHDCEIHC